MTGCSSESGTCAASDPSTQTTPVVKTDAQRKAEAKAEARAYERSNAKAQAAAKAEAAATSWYPKSWRFGSVDQMSFGEVTGDNLAWVWNEKAHKRCLDESDDYCWAITVVSRDGCPNGIYGEINVVVNGTVTGYSNALLGSLAPRQKGIIILQT